MRGFFSTARKFGRLSKRRIFRSPKRGLHSFRRNIGNGRAGRLTLQTLLRHILAVAIESGVIYANPATGLGRRTIKPKQLELPTRTQFAAFIAEMRAGRSRDSQNCGDLAQGLAFIGCRISEAAQIEWSDLNFADGEILVKGDAEEGTKNGEIRRVPMIPQARVLFDKMRAARTEELATEKLFLVHECQKSMDRAAKKIGMTRITHHDLRHFFATVSIESGVDIPTVSRWLGHKDGGALAMRTYGHLRREHIIAQAQKVPLRPDLKLIRPPAIPVTASCIAFLRLHQFSQMAGATAPALPTALISRHSVAPLFWPRRIAPTTPLCSLFSRPAFFSVVNSGLRENPFHLRRRNQDATVFRDRFDLSCVELPVAPSLGFSEQGGEFAR